MANFADIVTRTFQRGGIFVALWFFLWVIVFFSELSSVISVWIHSKTYNHCFFVFPVSLYFFWRERKTILAQPVGLLPLAALLYVPLATVWALGYAADIKIFTHVAMFGFLPVTILFLFGWKVALSAWFPLAFLIFAIPFGEELVPLFQEITADISVAGLKLIGIPFFREGLYITLPNGKFEVAEACAGIRFFIATICFGFLYAYINYNVWHKRTVFMLVSLTLPIVANGFRALGIILIGYYSDMEHAVGADHLVYGWGFFAFIIILLVVIGDRWRDLPTEHDDEPVALHSSWQSLSLWKTVVFAVLPLFVILIWRVHIETTRNAVAPLAAPASLDFVTWSEGHRQENTPQQWRPHFPGSDWSLQGRAGVLRDVDIYLSYYSGRSQGDELIAGQNRLYDIETWSSANWGYKSLTLKDHRVKIGYYDIRSITGRNRLVYYWYHIPGFDSGDKTQVKIRQALNILSNKTAEGMLVALSQEYVEGKRSSADSLLLSTITEVQDQLMLLSN